MSQQTSDIIKVFCGELCKSNTCDASTINITNRNFGDIAANVTIGYEKFVRDPESLPLRILDLLQIAAYVFCADRMAFRGARDSLNNESWARSFEFYMPVKDLAFWSDLKTLRVLCEALKFMTGDRKYNFVFTKAKQSIVYIPNKQYSLFTGECESLEQAENTDVMLFSGGLDSLAGAIERLNVNPTRKLCFVSHKANKTVMHTQSIITNNLNKTYFGRIQPYGFECHNQSILKSKDETQRSRMFLFSAIAFSICNCYDKHEFFVYENGITSINLPKQGDVINARASRTTHPKTLGLLREFYRLFDSSFNIIAPYYNKTKAEVLSVFKKYNEKNIIASSVSCSSTRNKRGQEAHCGCCSQCIDRRFSVYGEGLMDYDSNYTNDFVTDFHDDETKQRLYITMRLASMEEMPTKEKMLEKYPTDIFDVAQFWPGTNPDDKLDEIFDLFCRYGKSVLSAAKAMQNKYEDLKIKINDNSLLGLIAKRTYLDSPIMNRAAEIDRVLKKAIPEMFQREQPESENDFNDKVQAILGTTGDFTREYPVLAFGLSSYRPDHAQDNLIVESKFIRGSTTPSKATEGIAADITKIPSDIGVLFVVYDPNRKIVNDTVFIDGFEKKRSNCYVRIYR